MDSFWLFVAALVLLPVALALFNRWLEVRRQRTLALQRQLVVLVADRQMREISTGAVSEMLRVSRERRDGFR